MATIYRLSEVTTMRRPLRREELNSDFDRMRGLDYLEEAGEAWAALDAFRREAVRCRRYTYGDQWGDRVRDPRTGREVTEGEYIASQGKVPLKNNVIRRLVKSAIGQFASNRTEPVCVASDRDEQRLGEMMSIVMKYVYNLNRLWDVDKRTFEEYLITGIAVHKVSYGWNSSLDKEDTWVEDVDCRDFFFDSGMKDFRYWDCTLVGQLHERGISDLIAAFSHGSRERALRIRKIYSSALDGVRSQSPTLNARQRDMEGFLSASQLGLCRVIEVWRKESRERYKCHDLMRGRFFKIELEEIGLVEEINRQRLADAAAAGIDADDVALIEYEYFVDRYWVGRWLSPWGDILEEMESPYWHGQHPYAMSIYPFIHGEVHSFVADVLDQQRYVNRLITMVDFIMGASAKGVLLLPEDQVPDGMTVEQIAEEWTRYNGVILYRPKAGVSQKPEQISANSTAVGAYELLNLQLKLIDEISGVHGALQGQTATSGKSGTLYRQEAQNSALNLVDVLSSFNTFREDRDTKVMQVTQQYYKGKRYINIAGSSYSEEAKEVDPDKVRNVQFDLSITESTSTPAFRDSANEFLLQLFGAGQISIEELLENGDFPFADRLLQSVQKRKEEMQAAQGGQGGGGQGGAGIEGVGVQATGGMPSQVIPEDIGRQVEAGSSPLMNRMLRR